MADFWTEVVGCADGGFRAVVGVLQYASDAKVPDFDVILAGEEDVLGLEVAVQDFPLVDVVHSKSHLHEPVEHELFGEEDAEFLLLGDFGVEIPAVSVVHNNAQAPWNGKDKNFFSMKDSL